MTRTKSSECRIAMHCTELGWGGTETETAKLAQQYQLRGLNPVVLVDHPPLDRLESVERAGLPVVVLNIDPAAPADRYRDALKTALKESGAELLHCQIWERLPETFQAANELNLPIVLTMHATVEASWRFRLGLINRPLRFARMRAAFRKYNPVVINISDRSETNFRLVYRGVTRTRRVYCGDTLPDVPVDVAETGKQVTVLWVGSFIPRKRPLWALDVWERVLNRHPDARLIMIGDGPLWAQAKSRASEFPAGSVTLTGTTTDVISYLRRSQLVLHTSVREGIPMLLLQAANHGIPAVACNSGAIAEAVLDARTGYVVDNDDQDKIVDAVVRLIDGPKLRADMGKAARAHGERNFAMDQYVGETLKVYSELAGIELLQMDTRDARR